MSEPLTLDQINFYKLHGIDIDNIITPVESSLGIVIPSSSIDPDTLPMDKRLFDASSGASERNVVIHAFNDVYQTVLRTDTVWSASNYFFLQSGSMYYYIPFLVEELLDDVRALREQTTDEKQLIAHLQESLGTDLTGPVTIDDIKLRIQECTPGMPPVKTSNDTFFEFDDIVTTGRLVTPNNITREDLNLFKKTFTGTHGPFYSPVDNNLFVHDGQMYFTRLTDWYAAPTHPLLGVYFDGGDNTVAGGYCYFFPFEPLTPEQRALIKSYTDIETGVHKTVVIKNL